MKRVFVTGGEGFIGSSLIKKLNRNGIETASFDAELNFIENPVYYKRSLHFRKKHFGHGASRIYKGDIRDKETLKQAIIEFNPNVIVHLAGLPMARISDKFKSDMLSINMQGTLNVLEVFENSDTDKLIYTSSSMAYGHFKQTPQSEDFVLDPINTYGATKASGEYFVKLSKKDWVIVRPTSVYGFTDCANRVTQLLIDAAYNNEHAWTVEGETLDFSYIEDVTDGFVLCILENKAVGQTFNLSRGEARSSIEFGEILKKKFPKFSFEIRKATGQQVWRGPLDIAKAKKILNFSPKYSIEEGIEETINLINKYKFYNF